MKRLILAVCMAALIVPAVQAQPNTAKDYKKVLTSAGTTVALFHTRGFGVFTMLTNPVLSYKDKFLQVQFTKVMDSCTVWGGYVNYNGDTVWVPIPVVRKVLTVVGNSNQAASWHDSTFYVMSPVTTDQMKFTVDLSPYVYPFYIAALGKADSGSVYLKDIRRGGY